MIGIARPAVVVLAGGAAVVALVACSSAGTSAGTEASPTPAASGSRPGAPTSIAAPIRGSSAPLSSVGGASTANSAVRVADPSRFHLGSVGAGNPVRRDPQAVSFQTPSHNIRCTLIAAQTVTCEITAHDFAAATRPSTCTLNWLGSDVTLDTDGAAQGVCAGNPMVLDNSTVLSYGYRLTVGSVSCTSTAAALKCSAGQHGFALNRAAAMLR